MLRTAALAILLLATPLVWPQALPASAPEAACGNPKSQACKEQKQAGDAFARALKLKKAGHDQEAFAAFDDAVRLAPKNLEYITARELLRQQLVYARIQRGNDLLADSRRVEASAEFQQALELDPSNEFARERLRDVMADQFPVQTRIRIEQSGELHLAPQPGQKEFHFRGDSRALIETIARAFGITAIFDNSFVPRPVRFDIDGADFYTALQVALRMVKSFWVPLAANQVLIVADTPENHRQFERMGLRVFYLPESSTQQELNELVNVLRVLFDIRYVTQQPASGTITVRAAQPVLDAATRFVENFDAARPEVMLDMTVYEVNRDALRNMGIDLPLQFQAFNIPASAIAALQNPNVQDLINQLIASGGINQANSQAISALLSQLQNQQNSLFSQPVATFGSGSSLIGIPFPPATIRFSWRDSRISTLEHVTLRATGGNAATLRVGERFPILNATFAPIFNSTSISQVIGSQSFAAPFPSFNYEDLGLTLKATPAIQGDLVALKLELEIRALGTVSFNGVPSIVNRAYTTSIAVKNGEPAVVSGTISKSEQKSLHGIPGLAQLPGLSYIFGNPATETVEDEIMVVITPRIVRAPPGASSEIWLPSM